MKKYFLYITFFAVCLGVTYVYTISRTPSIPKIIHYVWLGKNPMPPEVEKVINSWKQVAPDYQIMRWDETNCDINSNPYAKESYEKKLYSWTSDYCRYVALERYGGVYLDTDHILYASPDSLLKGTQLALNYEVKKQISASFIAATAHHPLIKKLRYFYEGIKQFSSASGPIRVTQIIKRTYPNVLTGKVMRTPEISIYTPNYAMFDFGGPENIGEHLYYSLSIPQLKNAYYKVNQKEFLSYNAIPIFNQEKKDFIIPIDDKTGYVLSDKIPGKIIEQTDTSICLKESWHKKKRCFPKRPL